MIFLPTLTALVSTYQAFNRYASEDIKQFELTMTQFDLIATLGNQPAMTFRELGKKTLVTKGTLTGVVERLVAKGLLETRCNPDDARSQLVGLTMLGQNLFESIFPNHVFHLEKAFAQLSEAELAQLTQLLLKLKQSFQS
jgi:MarR family transcriptional regulator, 2-MHQ and catechol-resistance regulon repressor